MNKNNKLIFVVFLIALLLFITNCYKKKYIKIPMFEFDEELFLNFDKCNINYEKIDKYIILYNNKDNINGLLTLLEYLSVKLKIISENLNNINTTRTLDTGSYYKRKYAEIDENGNIIIKEDNDSKPKIVYDPDHPDSIKSGKLKGFVLYPNISKVDEKVNQIVTRRLYIVIGNIINKFDESFYIISHDVILKDYEKMY